MARALNKYKNEVYRNLDMSLEALFILDKYIKTAESANRISTKIGYSRTYFKTAGRRERLLLEAKWADEDKQNNNLYKFYFDFLTNMYLMTNEYYFYQRNIGSYKQEIARLIYKRMVGEGLLVDHKTTRLQFEAIANTLYALSYHRLYNMPRAQANQYVDPKKNPRGLFTLTDLSNLIYGSGRTIASQLTDASPTYNLYRAKNMLMQVRRMERSYSNRITIFTKSIDFIDNYDSYLKHSAAVNGTISHPIYNRIIYEILDYY